MTEKLTLEKLSEIVKDKVKKQEKNSYSAEIALQGLEKINRKIGEEALEVVIAAFMNEKNNNEKTRQELIGEICDLYYHSLILLAYSNIEFDEILQELTKRNNKK